MRLRRGFSSIFFFIFGVEFSKTNQIVVALVVTTLKALSAVAKTNGRLSGREFYAGNVYYLFLNILIHIFSYRHIKKVRNRSHAPKKHKPLLLRNKPLTNRRIIHIHKDGTCTFYQNQIFADAKRQSTPIQKILLNAIFGLFRIFIISQFFSFVNILSEVFILF